MTTSQQPHAHQKTTSYWQQLLDSENSPRREDLSLKADLSTQVVIVGAGISGLTTAYLLLKQGYEVVVIDKETIGRNETGLTTAHLSNALDDGYFNIRKWHGDRGAQLAYESHTKAIDTIDKICLEEGINCEFTRVPGYLFLSSQHNVRHLIEELTACHVAGFLDTELFPHIPVSFFNSGQVLMFPKQGQFHPIKYIYGLIEAISRMGGKIYWNSPITEVTGGAKAKVSTVDGYKVSADYCVVATNSPINNRVTIHTKEAAYRTYVIGMKVPHGLMQPMLIWDTEDPYHYIRLELDPNKKDDLLIIGGEDHRTGQDEHPEENYQRLEKWANQVLKLHYPVTHKWSGQILEPVDGLAFIGHNPGDHQNIFIGTGDSGHGMTHGTIAGLLLTDLIVGKQNEWTSLYSPRRKSWNEIGTYFKENLNTSMQYSDWLSHGDVDSTTEIEPREGAIISQGISRYAAYKDSDGDVHVFSATCPHLGGIVRWNSGEKTWDCPCHGSRFNCYGEVINGPAKTGLTPVDADPTMRDKPPVGIQPTREANL